MANKEVKKEAEKDVGKDFESDLKVFFTNPNITITDQYVNYTGTGMEKRIYIRNLAGTDFYVARLERVMAIITFAMGMLGLYLYKHYGMLFIVILSVLFMIGGIVAFFLSKDKLTIHSNSVTLSISYNLGMKEHVRDIQKALDDAVKYSRKR
jgi:hypothetical protein